MKIKMLLSLLFGLLVFSTNAMAHCQVPCGAYVQACHETNPTNTNAPRTIDAIYLRPLRNIQGGHEIMDLNSGCIVTRQKVTEVPITQAVINAIEQMAYK